MSREEFLRRAQTALGSTPPGQEAGNDAGGAAGQTLDQNQAATGAGGAEEANDDAAPSSSNTQNARIQAMLAERARRLEADKKAKEVAAKKEAEARAKARKEADANAPSSSSSNANIDPAERKYAEELRHRKQQDAEERRRILKRIEDDRRERKEREAQERQARLLAQTQAQSGGARNENVAAAPAPPLSSGRPAATAVGSAADAQRHQTCHLQVRLLTGISIRARFAATATLAADVRPWVDEEAAAVDPSGEANNGGAYSFRVVLTPRPNRAVAGAEESEQTLADLELPPSATLVVVPAPAPSVAEAYAHSGNPVTRALGYLLRFLSALWAFLASLIVLGGGGGRRRQDEGAAGGQVDGVAGGDDASTAAAGKSTSTRIRGFGDDAEQRRREAQLYNGNSVSPNFPIPRLVPFDTNYGRPIFANEI